MPKYSVMGLIDATTWEDVEANTPQEAADNADLHVSLCHQCSRKMNVGDPLGYIVTDEDGNEVYVDTPESQHDAKIAALNARVALLEDVAKRARAVVYVAVDPATYDGAKHAALAEALAALDAHGGE